MQIGSHPSSQEQLMAYLDGELSANEAAITAAHLQHCRECREFAADLQSVSRQLSAWQVDEPSPALAERLQTVLNESHFKKTERFTWFSFLTQQQWPLSFVAAGVVLVMIVSAIFSRHSVTVRPPKSHTYIEQYAKLQQAPYMNTPSDSGVVGGTGSGGGGIPIQAPEPNAAPPPLPAQAVAPSGPLIIRTSQLSLTTNDFPHVRESISRLLTFHTGYIAQLEMNTPAGEARSLDAILRIPATQLDATLLDLKRLGHVDAESQRGEEVTQRVIDIQARLSNLRVTEARLTDILRQRTGKLADVLAVEEQIDSVRGQIENIEAEQKNLNKQITFAAVQLKVREEYKKPLALDNNSLPTRLRNAAVGGFQTLADGVIGLLLFFLAYGPTLLIVAALLFYPARTLWKRRKRAI